MFFFFLSILLRNNFKCSFPSGGQNVGDKSFFIECRELHRRFDKSQLQKMSCQGKLCPVLSTVIYCFRVLMGNFELIKYKPYLSFWKFLLRMFLPHRVCGRNVEEKQMNSKQKKGISVKFPTLVWSLGIWRYFCNKPSFSTFLLFSYKSLLLALSLQKKSF